MVTTPTLVPVEEYLNTSYRPDRDYVDGETLERNMGETPHSRLQMFLGFYFYSRQKEWKVEVLSEQRVQINSSRYRIPDVCLVSLDAPEELVLQTPPILCIEILSREDRMSATQERVEDYFSIGVQAVWIVDPWRSKAYIATPDGRQSQTERLAVPGTSIELAADVLFASLKRQK